MEMSQKQQAFNSILYVHKLNSLKIPKPTSDHSLINNKGLQEHELLAKRAAGFQSKWIYDRSMHEIKSCLGIQSQG